MYALKNETAAVAALANYYASAEDAYSAAEAALWSVGKAVDKKASYIGERTGTVAVYSPDMSAYILFRTHNEDSDLPANGLWSLSTTCGI